MVNENIKFSFNLNKYASENVMTLLKNLIFMICKIL